MAEEWTKEQWSGAVLHLLRCDLPVEACRFCTAIRKHTLEDSVTIAEVKRDLAEIGCLPPISTPSK